MSEQIKLRECPFCGGKAVIVRTWNTRTEDKRIEKALEEIEQVISFYSSKVNKESYDVVIDEFRNLKSILKGEDV